MKLSVVIPAYNEAESITGTLTALYETLKEEAIHHEILVINDNSKDETELVLQELQLRMPSLRYINNQPPNGFGLAVRKGLENFDGDCVAVFMADLSDDPKDLVRFYHEMVEGNYDCVFGSRWGKNGGQVFDYPQPKKAINRLANFIVRSLFGFKYNDCTNAFKLYKKETIDGLKPFLSPHFNLTLELPLKAIVRGFTYSVLPNTWTNRQYGESKLKIREMGSRYFFVLLYCLIEKYFSMGDYQKQADPELSSKVKN
ncbi:MAG: glycosyltransferase family 2 protein [Bacteroidota bacterium]